MAIKIPPGEKIASESRLTLIRAATVLHDHVIEGDKSVKRAVKDTLMRKGSRFAQSDAAVAALRASSPRGRIDAAALYELVENGELELGQFLSCLSVNRKALEPFLSGQKIDALAVTGDAPEPSLIVEFLPGAELDVESAASLLLSAVTTPVGA